jgi:STE24 endopeptidase
MQQRLAETNLAEPNPPALWQWFFGSHPTTAERVRLAGDWETLHRR